MPRTLAIGVAVLAFIYTTDKPAQFTEWSTPVKVAGEVNSDSSETCVSDSKDGLSLYFARVTPGAGFDMYVSQSASAGEPWGAPVPVPNIGSNSNEFCPALSLDEHRLYFASNRPGGCGNGFTDIYVTRRHDRQNDFGWQQPVNLGCESEGFVNSARGDQAPSFFEDEDGTVVMYFASNRVASQGFDIYQSRMRDDDTFGPATPVAELNVATYNEIGTAIRRDGLEIVVDSTRPGGLGGRDLWTATRKSTSDPWSALVNLTEVNSTGTDGGRLSMSFDGRKLYFTSDRETPGSTDIYVATRERPGR